MKNLVIIGFGNMGKAFYHGLKNYPNLNITARNRTPQKVSEAGIKLANDDDIFSAEFLVVAVKPQQILELDLPPLSPKTVIISVLAGTSHDQLQVVFPQQSVVRCMPNLAIAENQGVVGWFTSAPSISTDLEPLFQHLGTSIQLPTEDLLDKSTLLSGSGPGYLAYIVTLLEQEALALGFDAATARTLVTQTFVGTAKNFANGITPQELQKQVSSPNGVTEKITQSLTSNQLSDLFKTALQAGLDKINQLKS